MELKCQSVTIEQDLDTGRGPAAKSIDFVIYEGEDLQHCCQLPTRFVAYRRPLRTEPKSFPFGTCGAGLHKNAATQGPGCCSKTCARESDKGKGHVASAIKVLKSSARVDQ